MLLALALLVPIPALAGCRAGAEKTVSHSPAADELIRGAEDDEERRGLAQARDDIDTRMSREAAEKDAEIEKLRKENEALRARLAK